MGEKRQNFNLFLELLSGKLGKSFNVLVTFRKFVQI